ncbi:MAG: HipA domain-containing protein, partial [Gammaproteobacteria bacterium]|nr:HipA domain-containing protein [Gammaproteobacteria bacterium]
SFRYDDIHNLLSRYSVDPETDFEQLLKLMLFNRGINNTDDHERNFSLIHQGEGYRLSPAYDLVPSLVLGEYHAAGFGYQPNPPEAAEVVRLGKVFGLSKTSVARCAEQVRAAIASWPDTAAGAGVSELEMELVGRRMSR